MNKIKYAISGIALALLTAIFMILPKAYNNYTDIKNSQASISNVNLQHNEQELTAEEKLRIIIDNSDNCIYYNAEKELADIFYISDCKTIVKNIFGDEYNSRITKTMISIIDNCNNRGITTSKFTAIDNDNIVVLNIIQAEFDNFSILYEQDSKIMLNMYLYPSENASVPISEGDFSIEFETVKPIDAYYYSLGLEDGKFYSNMELPYFYLYAGINPRANLEY